MLVYAHDPRDARKQGLALTALDALITADQAVLSVQCLSEFFVVATRRLPDRIAPAEALEQVERLAGACEVIPVTSAVAQEACRGAIRHSLSLWDALIWAAAKLVQVPVVLTEDASHGSVIEGVQYQDPFDPRFQLGALRDG